MQYLKVVKYSKKYEELFKEVLYKLLFNSPILRTFLLIINGIFKLFIVDLNVS